MVRQPTRTATPTTEKTDPVSSVGSVLILTYPFDPTADKVVDELNRRGVSLFRCDGADFPEKLSVGAELLNGRWSGQLRTLRRRLELDDVTGIYYRRPTTFEFHPDLSCDERRWAAIQARLGFGGLLASLDPWLNHPHNIGYAEYKPVQLRQAVACRLRVPRTLVTNEPETAQKFVTDSVRQCANRSVVLASVTITGSGRFLPPRSQRTSAVIRTSPGPCISFRNGCRKNTRSDLPSLTVTASRPGSMPCPKRRTSIGDQTTTRSHIR